MTQNTPRSSVTSRTIAVEHIRVSSGRPFSQVRQKLEATLPKLDTSIAEALGSGDQKRAKDYEENGPKLPIFVERDRDALLQIAGKKRHAMPLFFAARFEYDRWAENKHRHANYASSSVPRLSGHRFSNSTSC
jgi:hypothetical protein